MSIYAQFYKYSLINVWYYRFFVRYNGETYAKPLMPRKGYQSVTLKDEILKLLDTLPGGSRSEKIEKLIRDASIAISHLDPPTDTRAIITYILNQSPNWDKNHVWELVHHLLEILQQPLVDATVKTKADTANLLKKILNDKPLKDSEIAEISRDYEIEPNLLIKLRDRLFPKSDRS
ncbi:MAG: hypothetical protein PUP93_14440 [Rhizonema sp. NSF051]|nr:hypothetical protein [Rhizonema sp. NSF051]